MITKFHYQKPATVDMDARRVAVPSGPAHDLMKRWNFGMTQSIASYQEFILCPGDKVMAVWRPEILIPANQIATAIDSFRGEFEGEVYVGSSSIVTDLLSFKRYFPNTELGNLYALGEKITAPGGLERFVFARPGDGIRELGDCGTKFFAEHHDSFLITLSREKDILVAE